MHNTLKPLRLIVLISACLSNIQMLSAQIDWEPAFEIVPGLAVANRPRIVTDATGSPLVIYTKSNVLMFTRWDGNAFTSPVRLNPSGTTVASADWMGPAITAHGDTIYVVYKQTPEDGVNSHIWSMRSFNGGIDWDDPVRVEFIADGKSRFPDVTTNDEGHPIVAYMKFNPTFGDARWVVTRSDDYGTSFSNEVLASGWSGPLSDVCDCCPGTVTSYGETVVMVYRDNNENMRDSWAGISYNGGASFTEGKNIDQHNWEIAACPASGPDGIIIGDTLYSTFMNGASGSGVVYYNASAISADTVPPAQPIEGITAGRVQNFPRIDNEGDALAVVWRQAKGSEYQLASSFTKNIHEGLPASYDTLSTELVANADVALTDDQVMVVWQRSNGSLMIRMGTYEEISATDDPANEDELLLYPNPVRDILHLEGNAGEVRIYDLTGQLLIVDQGAEINISELSAGMYLLNAGMYWQPIIKL